LAENGHVTFSANGSTSISA